MKQITFFRTTALAIAATAFLACQPALAADTLTAVKAASAPNLASLDKDPLWAKAKALKIELSNGANFANGNGETEASLKALYTKDTLYMLIQYKDPTDSKRRGPYQKQADGTWKKLVDPANKGGDDNIYYEDKWAFIWPIDDSIKGFDRRGCAAMCHEGQTKPYGNKYTSKEGQLGDIWHMKGIRTGPWGLVDD
ncbi:MAG: ethylbenzene dehydrogenase-related protein, partial [Betaproteobacteria bacterium]